METPKLIKLGNGLSVPSVQELAKLTLAGIVTDDSSLTGASVIDDETVPVIDLQNLLSPEPLVNHGLDALLVDNVKSEIKGFFNLPTNEKTKYGQKYGDNEGFGQVYVESEDQRLDWVDGFVILTLPIHLRKPHLFPELSLPFRLLSFQSKHHAFSIIILDGKCIERMEKALQLVGMTELFEDGLQSIRMNYYPPCPRPELVIGFASHSDLSGLIILLQLNEVEGLKIRKEERWISIKPLPNAFIVNVGDVLEIMTNGIYRSIDHRVDHQAVISSTKERLSIVTFHDAKIESEIGPISSLVTPETPALFKRVRYEDILKGSLSRKIDGKSFLDCMRM
ncbi:hypothetical protein MKX01_000116 [Papaver californicum]|nr:hypothetical protein MKX01_000116 [Papaver californicum]